MTPDRPAPSRPPQSERKVATGRVRTEAPAAPAAPAERTRTQDRTPADAPLVVIRKSVSEADAAPAPAAPPEAKSPAPAAPAKPSRSERRAAEDARREAEHLRKQEAKEAERLREEQAKEAERRRQEQKKEAALAKAESKKNEELRRKGEAKDARKRERKHRRHSKRVDRRASELDLRSGERVSLSISGWSRFRRATLVVTNYRVALITQMPAQVRWIPLEEVNDVHHRWAGAHSLVVTSPIEVLTLQKSKREALGSFEQLLEAEVAEARRPGVTERHHPDITQEWCERSTEVWDSHTGHLRLWIRRHPVRTLGTLAVFGVAAYIVSSIMNPYG